MAEAFAVGAVFKIVDDASPTLGRLSEQFEALNRLIAKTKASLDGIKLPGTIVGQVEEMAVATGRSVDTMLRHFERLGVGAKGTFNGILEGGKTAFTGMYVESDDATKAVLGSMGRMSKGALSELDTIKAGSAGLFAGIDTEARTAADAVSAAFATAAAAAEAPLAAVRALLAETKAASAELGAMNARTATSGVAAAAGTVVPGRGASLTERTIAAHGQNNAAHGGFHFRPHGMSIPGGHVGVGQGGDGMAPLVGGVVIGELIKQGIEKGFDFEHWATQYKAAGFSDTQVEEAKRAAWANAGANPNASATDSLKNILELNKATGDLAESMKLLPVFSMAENAMQSVKAEGLHSKFNGGTQVLNLARGLEELGVTQRGKTPEEREANVKHYTQELVRTMIASRGLFDGNQFFAMTNNSGGAAQNFDERMATVVAPIIGDIMKHSKLGNADYMLNRSYAAGIITSKAVGNLVSSGLVDDDLKTGKVWQDKKQQWHLEPNSEFASGLAENAWDWSKGVLAKLQAHGIDTSNQKAVNEVVNGIGSNKSTTTFMRALLEPGTRAQIQKEMDLRDKVPGDAAGILQNTDPTLKMAALHDKLTDFFTALGAPLVDPAIAALTAMTSGINALAQTMSAHPELTKVGGMAAGVAGLGLFGYGATRMLGFGGGGAALSGAATALDGSALALKEAAAALMGRQGAGGLPGGGAGGQSPGYTALAGRALPLGLSLFSLGQSMPDELNRAETDGKSIDPSLAREAAAGDAIRRFWRDHNPFDIGAHAAEGPANRAEPFGPNLPPGSRPLNDNDPLAAARSVQSLGEDRTSRARASDALDVLQDRARANVWQFGQLETSSGIVKTSFDGLNGRSTALTAGFTGLGTGSSGLGNAFNILIQTAMGAARALAEVAMSGGAAGGFGGSGGFTNASYGAGGGFGGGGGAGGPINPGTHGWWTQDRQSHAVDVLKQGGVSELGAKALVSRWMNVEASGGPSTVNGIGATGIGQWLGNRKAGLPSDLDGQIHHALKELHGSESRALGYLNSGSALGAATGASQFERAEGYNTRTGMDNFTARTLRGMGAISAGRPATVSAPPPRKVSPGVPASPSGQTTAMNEQHHYTINIDGKPMYKGMMKKMASAARYPTSMGGPNGRSHYTSPGTPVTDAA